METFRTILILSVILGNSERVATSNSSCLHGCICGPFHPDEDSEPLESVICSGHSLDFPLNVSTEGVRAFVLASTGLISMTFLELDLSRVKYLDISSNGFLLFEHLSSDALEYLDVSHNKLMYVPGQVFSTLPNLRNISAEGNVFEDIHQEAFSGLSNLRYLNLSHNILSSVSHSWFTNLTSLLVLDISHNNLHMIKPDSFGSLILLADLRLGYNQLHHTKFLGIETTNKISNLDLSYNHLKEREQLLTSTSSVNYTSLRGNSFSFLPSRFLVDFNSTVVDLSHCAHLKFIAAGSFTNLPTTEIIDLSYSTSLVFLSGQAFQHTPVLKHLILKFTHLKVITREIIHTVPSLQSLDLRKTSISPSCYNDHLNYPGVFWNVTVSREKPVSNENPVNITNRQCKPTMVNLLPKSLHLLEDHKVYLHCFALGIPEPTITWDFSSGTVIAANTSNSEADVFPNGTLYIHSPTINMHGILRCIAVNSLGREESSVSVSVRSPLPLIKPLRRGADFIKLTWTRPERSKIYYLLFRTTKTQGSIRQEKLHYYLKDVLAKGLQPDTTYEFCISEDPSHTHNRCLNISTISATSMKTGIYDKSRTITFLIVGLASGVILIIAVKCAVTHRSNCQRRRLYYPDFDGLSQEYLGGTSAQSSIRSRSSGKGSSKHRGADRNSQIFVNYGARAVEEIDAEKNEDNLLPL